MSFRPRDDEQGSENSSRLQVFPVSIGHGLRVFPEQRTKLSWRLVDSQTFSNGVMANTFHPA